MSPRFENPKRSVFSLRTATPNPFREAGRARQDEKEQYAKRLAAERPTILDLPDYLERTGRKELWTDVESYDRRAVERSLLKDLDGALTAKDARQIRWLRGLILAAANGLEPLPTQPLEQIRGLVRERIAAEERNAESKRAATDDTEIEDYAAAQWRGILMLLDKQMDRGFDVQSREEALQYLEQLLRSQFAALDRAASLPARRLALNQLERLEHIRNAAYWRHLYPHVRFPTK